LLSGPARETATGFEALEAVAFRATRKGKPKMIYSNPRKTAIIENWPNGGHRVTAHFSIEADPKRGERAVRVTTGAPKKLTFARKMRIVDGDDGRTYIATLTGYGHITIYRGDMKYQEESIFEREPRYVELLALFET
jgi:hypothetical protein